MLKSKNKTPSLAAAARDTIVVVEVGPDRQKYHVHKALLTHHSEHFSKALQGPWKEADERMVPLHDVEPIAFKLFVHWLYTKQLPRKQKEEWEHVLDLRQENHEQWEEATCLALIKAYVFGDRFLAPDFRHAVNNTFAEDFVLTDFIWKPVRQMAVTYAFKNIPSNRVILQLLVDDYRRWWDDEDSARASKPFTAAAQRKLPVDLLMRVMRSYHEVERSAFQNDYDQAVNCYYEHATEEETKECPFQHMRYDEEADFGYFD